LETLRFCNNESDQKVAQMEQSAKAVQTEMRSLARQIAATKEIRGSSSWKIRAGKLP